MRMTPRARRLVAACIAAIGMHAASPSMLTAQTADLDAIASWVAVDAATGYERRIAPPLAAALGEWRADTWGNVVATVGSGAPHHVVACALDRPSYAISQITDEGYLRLHRIGRGSRHPLWDQQFEAQPVRVLTATGPVAGVIARANGHFAQQHRTETAVVTADDLWLDVGAASRADVEALGIALLDPIARHLPPWPIAGGVAGPDAGRRTGCAAVVALAAAARGRAAAGRTTFVLSAQEGMGWVGLSSLIARDAGVDRLTILAPGEDARVESERPSGTFGSFGEVLEAVGVQTVRWLAPATLQTGSHMEVVAAAEAAWLLEAAADASGVMLPSPARWIAAPPPVPLRTAHTDPAHGDLAAILTGMVERHAVSGHEWAVRRAVLEALPGWARDRAVVDDIGNIMIEAGPDGPATVFMAHMDEVGYVIESIAPDGTATLTAQGGAVASAWEGQTALVHFDPPGAPSTTSGRLGADTNPRWKAGSLTATAPAPLRGVFRIRAEADTRHPRVMQAWFGLDAAGLAARGVVAGLQVTSHKDGLRLGRTRYVARALDDRAGTTALVRALHAIDPATLPGRVIFTWSVHEEGGLRGAAAMARRYGRTTTRIYSIDTFVSSDTPLESPHFAYAPLGLGPVFRAIENSGVSPDGERARVHRIAGAAGLPLQIGLTQGGTDGTRFTFWGAPNQGLSWPGRYSHSPGEVLDLRDLDTLSRLIAAVARAGEP
ncbi:MAG: M20/M25/M40 family metallo-hydrolase [Vicinamibacterales bacterium]|nr:M20/M25/M40 family metallo-hydrolase [Vicinamibacterales bacterium]